MPEIHSDKKVFTLLELGESIQRMFTTHYDKRYWVKAEMNKLNLYGRSGHCFPDLVHKENGKVIAEMRAVLWKFDFLRINKEFKETLGEPLKEGIKILCQAKVEYSPKYGLTLRIIDIDVNFTLGDLARERKETLEKLKQQGLLDANKRIPMATLPKRIAIISVETSNGYADFIKVLETNPFGYRFEYRLFPSLLQGDRAVGTMLRQLEEIRELKEEFDLVAIIRGGGGDIGLSFLNTYELAHEVASFPLPVVTGIGHATNQTVVEMIAHTDAITPTEMADWLIQRFRILDEALEKASQVVQAIPREILFGANELLDTSTRGLRSEARRYLERNGMSLEFSWKRLKSLSNRSTERAVRELESNKERLFKASVHCLEQAESEFRNSSERIKSAIPAYLTAQHEGMNRTERSVKQLSPAEVLKRGYSITRMGGSAVESMSGLSRGTRLETEFRDGFTVSTIDEIEIKTDD